MVRRALERGGVDAENRKRRSPDQTHIGQGACLLCNGRRHVEWSKDEVRIPSPYREEWRGGANLTSLG